MWIDFEHQIWNQFKKYDLADQEHYLVAVSGGLDSMALFEVCRRLRPQAKMVVMHYHHGPGANQIYRDQCLQYLTHKIRELTNPQIIFESDQSHVLLNSEDEMRQARLSFFQQMKKKYSAAFYLTAHHENDVLETRLLKLIRGTGLSGFSEFSDWNGEIFRPFLNHCKADLKKYLETKGVNWLDDPTNLQNDYLRNWLRNQWLPDLETQIPGARQALSRSLQNIVDEFKSFEDPLWIESTRYITLQSSDELHLERSWFASLSTKDQLRFLAKTIKNHFKVEFSQGQLKESIKQLDKNQNDHIFKAAGIIWLTNRNSIVLKLAIKE